MRGFVWWVRWKVHAMRLEWSRQTDEGGHRWMRGACDCGARVEDDCGFCPMASPEWKGPWKAYG